MRADSTTSRPYRTRLGAISSLASLALLAGLLSVLPLKAVPAAEAQDTVPVQILGLNDFHGALEPPTGNIGGMAAGGAVYLATHIRQYREQNPNTVVVSAGDLIGASPLLSALFHDEPTIEAMDKMGLDFNAVGNHEFDEGVTELQRMQNGGCHPVDGCAAGHTFQGAGFQFLSANVRRISTGETVFPAYGVREFDGVKVAFVGMTLEGTPAIVSPSGIVGYEFLDEADTVNALVPQLQAQGIETIVVLIHQSGGSGGSGNNGYNGCSSSGNALINRMSPEIDVFITGHSHTAYNCVYAGRPVTQAASTGRLLTEIDLEISKTTGNPVSIVANNRIVTRTVPQDADQVALIDYYQAVAEPISNRVIGSITANITRTNNAAGESALGNLIADSHLWGAQSEGAQIAFMNNGGIRTDLLFSQQSGEEAPGEVTFGESFSVQPFGNNLTTMTMTGAQIERLLEQQFTGGTGVLKSSVGFTYTQYRHRPAGDRIDPHTIRLDGVTLDPDGEYRVVANSFLADGGDNFSVFTEGTQRVGGMVDADATAAYLTEFSPIAPPAQNRITSVTNANAADAMVNVDAPDAVVFGEPATVTITARNDGPAAAQDVTVTAAVPTGMTFVSASEGGAHNPAAGTVSWSLGSIPNLGETSVNMVLEASATGVSQHTATVSSTTTDPGQVNNTATAATTVSPYPFSGLEAPPALHQSDAGRSVAVRFSLGGDRGLAVLGDAPTSQPVSCATLEPLGPAEVAASAGALAFDGATDRYRFAWDTPAQWSGTCRIFTLTLADGTTHQALFRFRR